MKYYALMFILFSSVLSISAQKGVEKGLNSISKKEAEAIVYFLASDELEGRGSGARGGKVAAQYLISYLKSLGIQPLYGQSYVQPFKAYNQEAERKKRYSVNTDSINKYITGVFRTLDLQNILGYIPGENKDEYVIVGAHYDHLGLDENLEGDKIYNGADDNASGVSAVLQIAKAFVESGVKPKRNVVFAFWDGEEHGLLGSQYFVQSCPFLKQIKGYLNFDMIGRNTDESNPDYVVYFYTAAHPIFETWLQDDIKKYHLKLQPDYRAWDKPVGGSDNGTFAKYDIPIIWYHTDGHADYHKPSDEAYKLNWDKLVDITKSSFLNAWNLANEKSY